MWKFQILGKKVKKNHVEAQMCYNGRMNYDLQPVDQFLFPADVGSPTVSGNKYITIRKGIITDASIGVHRYNRCICNS